MTFPFRICIVMLHDGLCLPSVGASTAGAAAPSSAGAAASVALGKPISDLHYDITHARNQLQANLIKIDSTKASSGTEQWG